MSGLSPERTYGQDAAEMLETLMEEVDKKAANNEPVQSAEIASASNLVIATAMTAIALQLELLAGAP